MSTCTGSGYLNSTASCLVGVKAFIFLKALYFCLFISGCAVSLLLCGLFCSCGEQGPLSSCSASHCSGFSGCGARVLECLGFSNCDSRAPGHRLSSCGTRALPLHSTWDLPGSGSIPCLLHSQAESLSLSHQGSLRGFHFYLELLN